MHVSLFEEAFGHKPSTEECVYRERRRNGKVRVYAQFNERFNFNGVQIVGHYTASDQGRQWTAFYEATDEGGREVSERELMRILGQHYSEEKERVRRRYWQMRGYGAANVLAA